MHRTRVRFGRLALLLAVPGIVLGAAARAAGGSAEDAAPTAERRSAHVVRPGETLWEIARGLVGPEGDPRPAVLEIREMNGMGAGPLIPGTRLVLP